MTYTTSHYSIYYFPLVVTVVTINSFPPHVDTKRHWPINIFVLFVLFFQRKIAKHFVLDDDVHSDFCKIYIMFLRFNFTRIMFGTFCTQCIRGSLGQSGRKVQTLKTTYLKPSVKIQGR